MPFGAIDTPTQGGMATGASYVNFGWALTPQPKMIPTDGSTIGVLIDGASSGPSTTTRAPDIQSLFPGLNRHERRDRVPGHRYDDADQRAAHDLVDGCRQRRRDRRDRQPVLHGVERRGRADGGAGDDDARHRDARRGRARRGAGAGAPRLGPRGAVAVVRVGSSGRAVIRGEEIDRFEYRSATSRMRITRAICGSATVLRRCRWAHTGRRDRSVHVGAGRWLCRIYDLVFVRWAGGTRWRDTT